ncbi:MAG: 2-oxoacid:acceptor oxidoreductase family protein, partial [Adlercreutzia sp.]|nr:2-oxoacid:acceptor oxidoreductase family protein [Adlercreutzia sp.]
MINVLLAGVGGQGTVLAAKVLAQAALARGWQVRTAETIGMAQRGGNVTSHVRMGSEGEEVFSSLITPGTADMVIALEPGEAARALPYLAPGGVLVTATTAIQPVTAALASQPYRAGDVVAALENALQKNAAQEQQAEAEREAAFGGAEAAAGVVGDGCSPSDCSAGSTSASTPSA